MKPLSELVKDWRDRDASQGCSSPVRRRLAMCADEVEAWLREADKETFDMRYEGVSVGRIQRELLGTTRSKGKK